jgi:hypothetical protein
MKTITRRSTLAIGVVAASIPALRAEPQTCNPGEGREVGCGLRLISTIRKPALLPGYETLITREFQMNPGSRTLRGMMRYPMICHTLEGKLEVRSQDGTYIASSGTVWTCQDGGTEEIFNTSGTVAVIRMIELIAS